jgi:uncharacterized membrane protein YbhN (UPF0104 family)
MAPSIGLDVLIAVAPIVSSTPAVARATPPAWPLALLAAAAAVVLLAVLLRDVDAAALWHALASLPAWAWCAATLGLLGSYALRALRLKAEWGRRAGVRFHDCLQLMLMHNAAINLLPLRAGEASYALLIHGRWKVPLRQAAGSLLWLRLQDMAVLAALAIALLLPLPAPVGATLALSVVVLGATLLPSLGETLRGWLVRALHRPAPRLAQWLAPRPCGTRDERVLGWLCTAGNWALKLLVIGLLLAALSGTHALQGLRGALAGELAAVLPLQGPAGLGNYEAAVWATGALFGAADLPRLAAAALVVHLFSLALSVLSAAVLLPLLRKRGSTA